MRERGKNDHWQTDRLAGGRTEGPAQSFICTGKRAGRQVGLCLSAPLPQSVSQWSILMMIYIHTHMHIWMDGVQEPSVSSWVGWAARVNSSLATASILRPTDRSVSQSVRRRQQKERMGVTGWMDGSGQQPAGQTTTVHSSTHRSANYSSVTACTSCRDAPPHRHHHQPAPSHPSPSPAPCRAPSSHAPSPCSAQHQQYGGAWRVADRLREVC
mmetsp:Transcript_20209/g.49050  ORF Transcript_20209/g.49050 Transcript_20209/m.49050 type:complete len:213 (+) Transcript_20209:599-1237(+)